MSDPGDRFETAAADNAARVMSEPAPVQRETDGSAAVGSTQVQREGEEEEEPVQGLFVQREEAPEEEESAS